MKLSGPVTYELTFTPTRLESVRGREGATKFTGNATRRDPKLYIVSDDNGPVYVMVTQ